MKYSKITRVDLKQRAAFWVISKREACYSDCGLWWNDSILIILTFIEFLTVQTLLKEKMIQLRIEIWKTYKTQDYNQNNHPYTSINSQAPSAAFIFFFYQIEMFCLCQSQLLRIPRVWNRLVWLVNKFSDLFINRCWLSCW